MSTMTEQWRSGRHVGTRASVAAVVAVAIAVGFAGGRRTVASAHQSEAQGPTAQPSTPAPVAMLPSYSAVVDRVAPAVVTIRVEKQAEASRAVLPDAFREFFGPQFGDETRGRREGGLGSGVVLRPDGHILTNHHVIAGAERIRVDLPDGRTLPAKLVGSDAASDLAVLKIEASGLPTLTFGDSDTLKVGDVVLAFGNPLGVGQTVTMGIVSAKGRVTGIGDGSYEDFLQTDAPINQGNSGGALVNLQGELVGINAQILSPSGGNIGLGFAIPSVMARAVADQLTRDGVVHRSKLGVTVQLLTAELAESLGLSENRGALISDVELASPANLAGLQQGDVVVAMDGRQVTDANALRNQVASALPGSTVSVEVLRGGKSKTVSVRVIERETEPRKASIDNERRSGDPQLGMAVSPVTPQLADQLGLARDEQGVVVTDVDPAGPAGSAGLQPGDVITRVNERDVTTVAALRAAISARTDKPALMLVNRRGSSLFIALPRLQS